MPNRRAGTRRLVLPALALLPGALAAPTVHGGDLAVVAVTPPLNALDVPVTSSISVQFDRALAPATVTSASFWAFGRWSGTATGTLALSPDAASVTLTPDRRFSAGESVMVVLSHDLQAADGTFLRAAGWSWQFWTRALGSSGAFETIDTMTTRTTPLETSRAYGGIGTDLDGDGWLDITVVNEDTADLRVFLNRADGTGLYEPFLQPTFPVGDRASPSEPSDFDRDGVADVCVANINANSVSILLGVGDGTFAPQQVVPVGLAPRGIAVLDVDGDGDVDIVNTNFSSNNLSLLVNDGTGTFAAPVFFEGGGSGEWALAAAETDEDGVLDLVVGLRSTSQVVTNRSNGDGTFTPGVAASCGGLVWMLACGDVNGDGHNDVATANSQTNNGAVLLGDGLGGFGPPVTHATDPFPLATDLGDLDGDGDLDWITSSFQGDWFVFENDGAGGYAFQQSLPAPVAASCSVPMDIDNDGDLDLALIDELADVVILARNIGTPCGADLDDDVSVGFADLSALLAAWGPCAAPPAACPADIDGNGTVGFADLNRLLQQWGPCD